jgi:23S rRNA C2498 (ribose-2'-O)-methylase RlmM
MSKNSARLTTVSITRTEQEGYLCSELSHSILKGYRLADVECTQTASQTVVLTHHSHEDLCSLPLFFSAQCLPDAQPLHAESISLWATAILDAIAATFGETPPAWCLHVFEPASAATGKQYARSARVQEAVAALLKQKRRSYLRTLEKTPSPEATIVQVVLTEPTSGYVSIADHAMRRIYRSALARTVAGYHVIADDRRPPSRAFKKLSEAIEVFDLSLQRGSSAVDLGASPGGWTYVLREFGLSVTAIDRSPLAAPLMKDRSISWSRGDALTWRPAGPVDWLVCDVITTPENTARLVENWIAHDLCRNICVTMKFKGVPAIETLLALASFMRANSRWFDGRQLTHNKNELTLVCSR